MIKTQNKKFNPKVSIVIPVYNGSNYLREAIDSAISQTYKNIEIIVINDGSKDDGKTDKICKSYGNKIIYFVKENGGVATALNMGIEKMKGEYFSWLSHDDVYYPDKIARQVELLAKNTDNNVVVFSDFCEIDAEGNITKKIKLTQKVSEYTRVFLALETNSYMHGCSLLIPRELFKKYGTFDLEKKYTQDYNMWFKLASKVAFIHCRKILVKSRIHQEQDSFKMAEGKKWESDSLREQFVSELSKEEILGYSGDVKYYWNIYYLYKNGAYELFPRALVNKIHETFSNKISVSIIVPVYNVEKYISKCLDSLVEQTFLDFEVIIVDDGTPDKSAVIAEQYVKACNSFMRLIHKKNGGLGSARNEGLKYTNGKYVGYVDSDDYVNPEMFKKLYKKITEGYDIAICGFNTVDSSTLTIIRNYEMPADVDFNNINEVIKNSTLKIPPCAWNKLFRKELLYKIGWGNGFYEDLQATPTYFSFAKNVGVVREPLYSYRINRQGSIMSSKRDDPRNLSYIDAWKNLLLKANPKFRAEIIYAIYIHIWDVIQVYPSFSEDFKRFFDDNIDIFRNNKLIKRAVKNGIIKDLFNAEFIPKKIHYIWFGFGSLSELNSKCVESWKRFAPDYEIIQWNESNCNIEENCYVKEAYFQKKWAFVSDYFRFKILYENGGIYVDTDTEFNQNIDQLRINNSFFGFEKKDIVHGGIIGATKKHPVIKQILESYRNEKFTEEKTGLPIMNNPVPQRITKILLEKYGLHTNGEKQFLKTGIGIYPINVLTVDCNDGKNITEHHYENSWGDEVAIIPYKYYVTREYFKDLFLSERERIGSRFEKNKVFRIMKRLYMKVRKLPILIRDQGFFLTLFKIFKKVFKLIFFYFNLFLKRLKK